MAPENNQTSYESVRAHDPERYLTALMARRGARDALMALYAFNCDLARIPLQVSEPALGEFRLQWWRDVLERMGGNKTTGAPAADALIQAVDAHDLPKPLLLGMIDARSADLDGGGFADLTALKAYLYKSEGSVFELSARILGGVNTGAGPAVNAAALACGLVSILRALPRDAAAGRIMLPLSLLDRHAIEIGALMSGEGAARLKPVLDELAGEARAARDAALRQMAGIDPAPRRAFAPLALVEPYLKAMARPAHRPLRDMAEVNPLVRFWKLWRF